MDTVLNDKPILTIDFYICLDEMAMFLYLYTNRKRRWKGTKGDCLVKQAIGIPYSAPKELYYDIYYNTCKSYRLYDTKNKDIFIFKIFNSDLNKKIQFSKYNNEEILNEIRNCSFINKLETVDLCFLLMKPDVSEEARKILVNKALYLGYKSSKDIIGSNRIENIVNILLKINPCEFYTIDRLFCEMAILSFSNNNYYIESLYRRMSEIINDCKNERQLALCNYYKLSN